MRTLDASTVEPLQRALEPYRHLDPLGWVGVFRLVPPAVGGALVALGLLLLLFGGRRLFRLVAAPLGAGMAVLWTAGLAARLGYPSLPSLAVPVAAAALGLTGLIYPPLVVFFAFGLPAGLLAGEVAGPQDWLLGFAPGFLFGGALGMALHRVVGAVVSSAVGAWLTVLGAMALAGPGFPGVAALADTPAAVFAVAAGLAVGGIIFQLLVRASPEAAAQARKAQKRDSGPFDQRWSKYGKKA